MRLSIFKSLIESMRGTLWVAGRSGMGGIFYFIVGLGQLMGRASEPASGEKDTSSGISADGDKSKERRDKDFSLMAEEFPCRILIVEDNEANRKILMTLLKRYGYSPSFAGNGKEAVAVTQSGNFDLIFMDLRMPGMDGLAATRRIRESLPGDRQPAIIALTAHVVKGEKEKCLHSGMNDFLPKPVDPAQLRATVKRYCPKREQQE